jgi:glycosyltransferase involved in cell wall biosynthesis
MNLWLSVIISTHNPDPVFLNRTLNAINAQTLDQRRWELIVVDNASAIPVSIDGISWNCARFRVIREERLGLTYGRLTGIRNSESTLLVFVDDDNELAPDYLETANSIFNSAEDLGIAGGIVEPEWSEEGPENWASGLVLGFAQRNYGDTAKVIAGGTPVRVRASDTGWGFPEFLPMGAGMVARHTALKSWVAQAEHSTLPDRRGTELTTCGDTDMVLEAFRSGWSFGYFPELKLTHLIPPHRLRVDYLARLWHDHDKCWVELLYKHGLCHWTPAAPWTVPLRKARAYFRHRAWAGPAQYVCWQRVCGHFEGRAALFRLQKGNNKCA